MRFFKLGILGILLLCLSGSGVAQPYALGWDDINTDQSAKAEYTLDWENTQVVPQGPQPPAPEEDVATEAPPAATETTETTTRPNRPSVDDGRRILAHSPPRRVPSYTIELSAYRIFDSYTDRYRSVNHVEVVTYRGGYPQHEIFENRADFNEYEVYLRDMRPGDRYEARVVWDDGSSHYLERTIDRFPEENVIIDQPLTFGARFGF